MIYAFENFALDAERRELLRNGALVPIEPQVLDLLLYLIRNRDRVVSKDELIAAVWNGRIVSESALSSRLTAVRHAINDSGDGQRLVRTLARKGLRFVGDVREQQLSQNRAVTAPPDVGTSRSATIEPELSLPDKPSIVVLPFANLSGDPSQDYFADGMVEDITIALGRLPWLFVIGSIAAFTYKNRPIEVRQISSELGVRYVLRGSVRREGSRVRITAELTDALQGRHIWADRFDGELDSVFELQDRVATHVSAMIAPALRNEEIERARRKPTANLSAYDLFLRALPGHTDGFERNLDSLRLLYRAIEIDPSYSAAYGLAAWCYFWQKMVGWVPPDDPSLQEGIKLANRAAELGPNDSEALWMSACALTLLAGELEQAISLADKSLSLNPNSPNACWSRGVAGIYLGGVHADIGLDLHVRARRLNPVDPWGNFYSTGIAVAHFFAGRFDQAAEAADIPLAKERFFVPALRVKASACGLLGRVDEGRRLVSQILAANPNATIAGMRLHYEAPLRRNPDGLKHYLDGLTRAGLPEG